MVGAFIGEELASAKITMMFEKVASIVNYFEGRKPNDELLQKLKIMLISANAVLIDVEVKEITNSAMEEWLNKLKDAVYDVDDLLDEIATEALQCKLEAKSQTRKRKYFKFISSIVNLFEKGIESELVKILHRLEYIT